MFPFKIVLLLPVTLGTDTYHLKISAETSILFHCLLRPEAGDQTALPRWPPRLPSQREVSRRKRPPGVAPTKVLPALGTRLLLAETCVVGKEAQWARCIASSLICVIRHRLS